MGPRRDTSHLLIPVWVPGQDDPEFDPEWALPRDEHPDFEEELEKHYGPGPHPGTGTEQAVHGRSTNRIGGPVSTAASDTLHAPPRLSTKLADPATPFEGYEPWSVLDQTIEIDGEEMTIRQWWEAKESADKDIDSILYDLRRETGISADKTPPVPGHYRFIKTDESTGYYGKTPKLLDDLTPAEALTQMSDLNEHMKRLEQELYWHNTQGRRVPYGGTSQEAAAAYARRQQESMLRMEHQMGKSHMLQLARKALPLVIEHGAELRAELTTALVDNMPDFEGNLKGLYLSTRNLIAVTRGEKVEGWEGEPLPEWAEYRPLADKLEETMRKAEGLYDEAAEGRGRWTEWRKEWQSRVDSEDIGIGGIGGTSRLYVAVRSDQLKEVSANKYGDKRDVPKSGLAIDMDHKLVSVPHTDPTPSAPPDQPPWRIAAEQVLREKMAWEEANPGYVLADQGDFWEMQSYSMGRLRNAGKRLDDQATKLQNELWDKISGKTGKRDAVTEAIVSTLSRYRELGGTLDITNQRATKAVTMIRSMEQFIPADWVRYSNIVDNGRSQMDVKLRSNNRGHYLHSEGTLQLDGRATITFHEFGHRMEYVNPMLRALELAYIDQRSADEDFISMHEAGREYAHYKNYSGEAHTRPDRWANAYAGKDYDGQANEVVSMGMGAYGGWLTQNLTFIRDRVPFGRLGGAGFGGKEGDGNTNMIDPEHMDFILGLLRDA